MRRVIQAIIFCFVFFVGFQILRYGSIAPKDWTLGQQSMLELFLMFVLFFASLVITKLLSRYISNTPSR